VVICLLVEGERPGMAEGPQLAALELGPKGFAAVIDEHQPVPVGDPGQDLPIRGNPEDIHRHDGPGAMGDPVFQVRNVEIEGIGIHLHENRLRSLVENRIDGRGEGERRHQNLVPRAEPEGFHDQMQGSGSGTDRYRVLDANILGHGKPMRAKRPAPRSCA